MSNTSTINKERLRHLDLYKGIAILFVIITHYEWTDQERLSLFFPFWIDMAVPIFMIITGYVTCVSFERRGYRLVSCYKPIEIITKWLRFIIPFIPAWILTVIARVIGNGETLSVPGILLDFLIGGTGRGSYYFPVMLQVVLLIPLIWQIVKANPIKGLIICFVSNILFEGIKTLMGMSPDLYRICSFRYLFVLGYGCFLYYNTRRNGEQKWSLLIGVIGIAYIILFNYTNLKPIITDQWTVTSVFAVMYLVPIMMLMIDKSFIHNRILELLGKASFNIFLVQMVFYLAGDEIVYKYISIVPLRIIVNILVCCLVGVIYYKIENPVTKRVISYIRNKNVIKT